MEVFPFVLGEHFVDYILGIESIQNDFIFIGKRLWVLCKFKKYFFIDFVKDFVQISKVKSF